MSAQPVRNTTSAQRCSAFALRLHGSRRGFSLLEVLVVMGVISLLTALLLPGLSAAREQAHSVVCRSNIHQIILANQYYAEDFGGAYCPGASDFLHNLHRWHGVRSHPSEAFDSSRGPLVPYVGASGAIRQCPSFPADEIAAYSGGFERGNGGYGYNNAYIGVRNEPSSSRGFSVVSDRTGALAGRVRRPPETVMFTDSAFAADALIEYSFCEPRFLPGYPAFRADPSVHFRHRKRANVGWCDGHVGQRLQTFTWSSGLYRSTSGRVDIGWFGETDDNALFDLN